MMKRMYLIAAVCAALSAALCAAPTANEDFVVAEAAAAYSNAVYTAGTNTAAATNALAEALTAAMPTDNAQLANGAGYVTKAVTNGLLKTESDPTVPEWAKASSAPLPPNYAAVSNAAMNAVQPAALTAATNALLSSACSYTDAAITEIPPPPNYAAVSNAAMNAVQSETDPSFAEWAAAHLSQDGVPTGAQTAIWAYTLGGPAEEVYYTAEDITAATNSFRQAVAAAALAATNYTDSAISAAIANTNPAFSNAVLSVGLGIDTNTVAAINALVEAGDDLPIGGATSVGALLLALAAAVAALKRTKADASALRYAMPAAVALVAENDAATLVCADRAVTNATIASGFATLNLTFPAAVSGYVRDFYLRITVAAGESAPALSLPQGVTIENAGGAVPVIADGEASAAATTLVWFSETAPGIFTAKSETVKAVA